MTARLGQWALLALEQVGVWLALLAFLGALYYAPVVWALLRHGVTRRSR